MQEPSVRTSRLAIAAGLVVAAAAGTAGFVIGRGATTPPPPVAATVPAQPTAPPTPVATPPARAIDRGELARLANLAADAAASGSAEVPEGLVGLAGRRLSIAIPFGCGGSAPEDGGDPLRWRYDADAGVLRIHVAPVVWPGDGWGLDRAYEGFWVSRPWASAETCPTRIAPGTVAGAESVTLSGQTLAIGRPRDADAPEAPRPFEAVVRLPADRAQLSGGLRARLVGRVGGGGGAGGPAIRCAQPGGPEQRPICLVGAEFSELLIENPATGEVITRWTLDQPADPRN